MSSVIDALNAAEQPWAAISSEELAYASRTCLENANGLKEAYQAFTMYMLIASKRRNDKCEASITGKEAALYMPKFVKDKGKRKLGMDVSAFYKGPRKNLKEWGLISYKDGNNKQTTDYRFPFIDSLAQGIKQKPMGKIVNEDSQRLYEKGQGEIHMPMGKSMHEDSYSDGKNHIREFPLQQSEGNSIGIEIGNEHIPAPEPQAPSRQVGQIKERCEKCGCFQEVRELTLEGVYGYPIKTHQCLSCGWIWPADGEPMPTQWA